MNERIKRLQEIYPQMYANTYDIWVGPGWMPIVERLSHSIQQYIDAANSRRQWLIDNGKMKYDELIPEPIEQVTVAQVKEKFGELRFYYDGGDEYIAGLVEMAEQWAGHTCEECGKPGHLRGDLSWIKTLCDIHYAERLVGKGNNE